MRWLYLTGLAVVLAGLVGCGGGAGSAAAWQARLDATLEMRDAHARDMALAKLSQEAGMAGEGEVVKKAVAQISETHKDVAAEVAALKLAWVGKTEQAIEVARMIGEAKRREAVLAKLEGD